MINISRRPIANEMGTEIKLLRPINSDGKLPSNDMRLAL